MLWLSRCPLILPRRIHIGSYRWESGCLFGSQHLLRAAVWRVDHRHRRYHYSRDNGLLHHLESPHIQSDLSVRHLLPLRLLGWVL